MFHLSDIKLIICLLKYSIFNIQKQEFIPIRTKNNNKTKKILSVAFHPLEVAKSIWSWKWVDTHFEISISTNKKMVGDDTYGETVQIK